MVTILTGDCRELLKTMPEASVNCCVTSPPYYGLRSVWTVTTKPYKEAHFATFPADVPLTILPEQYMEERRWN